ncbi:hypothetical protein LGV61_07420 [Desulfurispirillum indicum]|uniref:hypothetical protein n=1 Tax=Desulfurispirillum indicum TaxID=936456 RepID=UPI001CF9A9D4|nr:hypothetical protein [Desulfurispirillum indicum]UCZ55561.1 hypothetical protein LGV61_07420 [Desulfurispirillum indicum]
MPQKVQIKTMSDLRVFFNDDSELLRIIGCVLSVRSMEILAHRCIDWLHNEEMLEMAENRAMLADMMDEHLQ